jgi:predicted ester cyclase
VSVESEYLFWTAIHWAAATLNQAERWGQFDGGLRAVDVRDPAITSPAGFHHVSGPEPGPGVEGVRQFVAEIRRAFPDLHGIIENQIAEGDKAMGRERCTGTHEVQFAGLAPTSKQAAFELIDINRFDASGKVVEHWSLLDMLGLLQQLGAVPAFEPGPRSWPWPPPERHSGGLGAARELEMIKSRRADRPDEAEVCLSSQCTTTADTTSARSPVVPTARTRNRPCGLPVRGLRIPVASVVAMGADGMSIEKILADLPDHLDDDGAVR